MKDIVDGAKKSGIARTLVLDHLGVHEPVLLLQIR